MSTPINLEVPFGIKAWPFNNNGYEFVRHLLDRLHAGATNFLLRCNSVSDTASLNERLAWSAVVCKTLDEIVVGE